MTPAAQVAAIAQACGIVSQWTLMKRGYYYRPNAQGYTSNLAEAGRYTEAEAKQHVYPHVYPHDEQVTMHPLPLPDYLGDLNAIRAAVADHCSRFVGLDPAFVQELAKVRGGWVNNTMLDLMLHATAAEWAEAFLRVTGRWDDFL